MKISIVMAYYNRRKLLLNTLYSITKTQYKDDLEIIIVDDGSSDSHKIDDLEKIFPKLDTKVVVINPNKKWWINPCIPYNIGFNLATGDSIIIQNPECLHMHDIISYVSNNLINNTYLAFGSYAIGAQKTSMINEVVYDKNFINKIHNIIYPLNNMPTKLLKSPDKWYQHGVYSPGAINFCCAIKQIDLEDLGGFDERYARGIAKDDREFVVRIKKKGMNIVYVDDLFVIHQCHGYTNYNNTKLVNRNNMLFQETVKCATYKIDNKTTFKLEEVVL